MPYQREAEAVLAMWREVERKLEGLPPGSPEAAALVGEWARLRTEHLRLIDLARANQRPAPAAWPDAPESDEDQATG